MWNEAISELRALKVEDSFKTAVKVTELKTLLNMYGLIVRLPEVIKEAEDEIERGKVKQTRMIKAQEGGTI